MKTITNEEAIAKLEGYIAEYQAKIETIKSTPETADLNCDSDNPNDPHYGEPGHYTPGCVWVPDNGGESN